MNIEFLRENVNRFWGFVEDCVKIVSPNDPGATLFFNGHDKVPEKAFLFLAGEIVLVDKPCRRELRLNDNGLKLYWGVDVTGKITAYIGGDQAKDYPESYLVMTMLLKKHDLLAEDRQDGEVEPFALSWMDKNWPTIKSWAWEWVREHPELLPESIKEK